jgi:hypothetical protein
MLNVVGTIGTLSIYYPPLSPALLLTNSAQLLDSYVYYSHKWDILPSNLFILFLNANVGLSTKRYRALALTTVNIPLIMSTLVRAISPGRLALSANYKNRVVPK